MLNSKLFQVRDRGTNISVLCICIDINAVTLFDYKILRHAGYGPNRLIMYVPLIGDYDNCTYNHLCHNSRTRSVSHMYIEKYWPDLVSGTVIDVEYILGETPESKTFE